MWVALPGATVWRGKRSALSHHMETGMTFRSRPSIIASCATALAALALLGACSPAANQENGRVPGGTNQQQAINAAGDTGASNSMPGIGAPGTGGEGTQP